MTTEGDRIVATWGGDWTREARARWATDVADGQVSCHLCSLPIGPGQQWDIDHLVPLAAGGDMRDPNNQRPAHARCNRSRGASMGNQMRRPAAPHHAEPWVSPGFLEWMLSFRDPAGGLVSVSDGEHDGCAPIA